MSMKLYILKPLASQCLENGQAWFGNLNVNGSIVVRADSEERAREMASWNAGDELKLFVNNPWLDKELTSCKELTAEGEEAVIIFDTIVD